MVFRGTIIRAILATVTCWNLKVLSNTVLPLQMGEGLLSFCTSSGRASPLKCLCSYLVYVWFPFKWQEGGKCASPVAVILSSSWSMCQQGCWCWPWLGDWAEPSLKVLLSPGFAQTQALPLTGKEGQGGFGCFLCLGVRDKVNHGMKAVVDQQSLPPWKRGALPPSGGGHRAAPASEGNWEPTVRTTLVPLTRSRRLLRKSWCLQGRAQLASHIILSLHLAVNSQQIFFMIFLSSCYAVLQCLFCSLFLFQWLFTLSFQTQVCKLVVFYGINLTIHLFWISPAS